MLIGIGSHIIADRSFALDSIPVRRRVLIVEDEAKLARSLGEGIAAHGFDVRTAATGEEGFFLAL